MPSTLNFVTQWKSAMISVLGSAMKSSQFHRRSPPPSVAPYTHRSQVCGLQAGTGP